jgi:acetyl esterase
MSRAPFMLDPDAAALLQEFAAAGGIGFERLGVTVARDAYRAACVRRAIAAPAVPRQDHKLDGVDVRVYFPQGRITGPALVFCHGGGWVLGDLDTHDAICRRLAARSTMMVFAIDYRRAPEHRFPAAYDDVAMAWRNLPLAAQGWGYAPAPIGLAGDSAGAGLAASVALGDGPRSFCQLLFYPTTDLTCASASYARFGDSLPLTATTMGWFIDQYQPAGQTRDDPRCSPLFATNPHAAPPSFIATAGADPLRDEGAAFADRLAQAGVQVARMELPGQLHGFLTAGGVLAAAGWALDAAADFATCALQHWRPTL